MTNEELLDRLRIIVSNLERGAAILPDLERLITPGPRGFPITCECGEKTCKTCRNRQYQRNSQARKKLKESTDN